MSTVDLVEVRWVTAKNDEAVIMAALHSRCGHYILPCDFYLFSSPNLSGRTLDVYHTSTHDVALVRI